MALPGSWNGMVRCWPVLLGTALWLPAESHTLAAAEYRDYTVLVDGKRAGTYNMTMTPQVDQSVIMTAEASVSVRVLVFGYTYTLKCSEKWQDGRLKQLNAVCDDNGKKFQVQALAASNVLWVNVNGVEHPAALESWTTTYWQLPDQKLRNQPLAVMDADTGQNLQGTLRYIGRAQMNISGQVTNCTHYQVNFGTKKVDLWFDEGEKLVREDTMDDGHRMVLQLTKVRN